MATIVRSLTIPLGLSNLRRTQDQAAEEVETGEAEAAKAEAVEGHEATRAAEAARAGKAAKVARATEGKATASVGGG
jgi:hypothetical protein